MDSNTTLSRLGWLAGILLCAGAIGVADAQGASPIAIDSAAYQEIEVKAADGSTSTKLEPAARIAPGGVVLYEITYRNNGDQPATNVAINNPVAKELVFLETSMAPSAVSVDDGKHFGALESMTVTGADGTPRPAQAADVTNLRWTISSLAPNASGKVTFRARVR